MVELNKRQMKFCVEYLKDFNATQAYLRAGYKCTQESAANSAYRMMRNDEFMKVIDEMLLSVGLSKHFVLKRLFDIANSSIACLFNNDGTLKKPNEISQDDLRTFASFKIKKRLEYSGPESEPCAETNSIEVKFWSKIRALENLGRYFKLFTGVNEEKSSVEERLNTILQRADEIAERYHEEMLREKKKKALLEVLQQEVIENGNTTSNDV